MTPSSHGQPWSPRELNLLGTMPDTKLAQKINRSLRSIQTIRLKRKIPAVSQRPAWTAAELKLLGTASDAEIARRLGRPESMVAIKRRASRILLQPAQLKPQFLKRLGKVPDVQLTREAGCSLRAVSSARRERGIRPCHIENNKAWTKPENALLGTVPDREVAVRLRRPLNAVVRRRTQLGIPGFQRLWTPAEDKLLGKLPDSEVAKRLTRTVGAVQSRRKLLAVPPFLKAHRWTAREDRILRTHSFADAAKRLNRTPGAIRKRLHDLGLRLTKIR